MYLGKPRYWASCLHLSSLVRLWWCWIISFLGPGQSHSAEVLRGCLSQAQHWSFIFHKQVRARRGLLGTGVHTSKCAHNQWPLFYLRSWWERGRGRIQEKKSSMCYALLSPRTTFASITYNGILLSCKKEWSNAMCSNMDGPGDSIHSY